jgi:hypothetical protein
MTLLAPPNILPNAMFLICKALTPRGAFNADRLKALVQPPSLRLRQAGPSTYDVSLKALVDLHLVVRDEERLRLDSTVRTVTVGDFYQRLLLAVMGQADDREGTAQDLLRMLSWFATQDPYGAPFDWPRAERQLLRQYEDAGMRPVTNSNPYEAFERWAVALGFAERGADGLTPDATRALLVTLPALPPATGPVPLGGVLTQLRTQLPVLDGGRSARAERALLAEDAEHRADPAAVDAYLTHALLRCEEEGGLRLTAPSDADLILLSDGGSVDPRSHIEVLPGATA